LLLVPGMLAFSTPLSRPQMPAGRLISIAMVTLPFVMGATAPAHHLSNHAARYYVIFPVFAVLLAFAALDLVLRLFQARMVVAVCILFLLAAPLRTYEHARKLLVEDVDSTEQLYHAMGDWVRTHIPPDAIVATNDIGALGYFAKREFIDIMGLSTPE